MVIIIFVFNFCEQVSPLMDFIFNLVGGSYHLWSPIIYSYFHPKFRKAAKEYIEEEVSLMIYGIISR